jgi:hypothetical protein
MTVKQNEKKIADLTAQIDSLQEVRDDILIDLSHQARTIRESHSKLNLRCYYIEKVLDGAEVLATCMGPLWTTQDGHRRPLSMLSTEHLENLVNGRWLEQLPVSGRFAQNELARRKIDTDMRKKPNPFKGLFRKLFR